MGKVRSFFARRMPRVRIVKFLEGDAMSIRWGNFGCDVVTSRAGYHLIQYGKRDKVTKFVCRVNKKAVKPPMFLLTDGWRRFYNSEHLIAGETDRPISLAKLWR